MPNHNDAMKDRQQSTGSTIDRPARDGTSPGDTIHTQRPFARLPDLTSLLSVRAVIWLIAVLPTLVAGATLLWLSDRASERVASDLMGQLVAQMDQRVASEVRGHLHMASIASELMARRIHDGELDFQDLGGWLRPSLAQLEAIPEIASVTFGTPDGRTFWVVRTPGGYECALQFDGGSGMNRDYRAEAGAMEVGDLLREYPFDPRERPWYRTALESDEPTWTDLYTWAGAEYGTYTLGTAFVRRIEDNAGGLIGVLSIDVTLGALSDFLAGVEAVDEGLIALLDEEDSLVAASRGSIVSDDGERLDLAAFLNQVDAAFELTTVSRGDGRLGGTPARFAVQPIADWDGLPMRLVIAVPEAGLLMDARRTERHLLFVGAFVIAGVALASVFLTNGLSRRLRALSEHVHAVGRGNFDSRLDERGPVEWRRLAADLNIMAAEMEGAVETRKGLEIAMEVQQALLPEAEPEIAGLQIAGRSKYCDATGGDYYDFLEFSRASETSELIAVGDVMGHGIAAALVMASARAALRSLLTTSGSLGHLMTEVNNVLSADSRHNRFMTMSLLVIEPEARTVRWASAGHDPVILFDPSSREFKQLEGGNLPLGIMGGITYEEYQQAELPRDALLFVGTDGVWEMRNEAGELYGKERLIELVRTMCDQDPQTVADAIDAELMAFRGESPALDDVTFVVVRVA